MGNMWREHNGQVICNFFRYIHPPPTHKQSFYMWCFRHLHLWRKLYIICLRQEFIWIKRSCHFVQYNVCVQGHSVSLVLKWTFLFLPYEWTPLFCCCACRYLLYNITHLLSTLYITYRTLLILLHNHLSGKTASHSPSDMVTVFLHTGQNSQFKK